MKVRTFLIGAIFTIFSFVSQAQVYTMFSNGFETTDVINYSSSPSSNVSFDNSLSSSGNRSIKITQSNSTDVEFITDTIDFSSDLTLTYIAFEFDHINTIATPTTGGTNVGTIFYKRKGDDEWHQLTGLEHYDKTSEYSTEFGSTSTFNRESYSNWGTNVANNDMWHHERFNINAVITNSLVPNQRKLLLKFVVKKNVNATANGTAWWIDNIRVRASQSLMITPMITMRLYPDGMDHPSSRGARVALQASTSVAAGINPDSVYVIYKVGDNPTEHRLYMEPYTENSTVYGAQTVYQTRIPFEGFDTLMHFYCVVRDATTNANQVTYPRADNSWVTYRCVRGDGHPGVLTPEFTGTLNSIGSEYIPFPSTGKAKTEWVYDSTLMANAGYKPGAISSIKFAIGANTTAQTRTQMQIRMRNASADYGYVINENDVYYPYTSGYFHVVYDGDLPIAEMGAGSDLEIELQDSFYYAGKDVIIQIISNNTTNLQPVKVKHISTPNNLMSLYVYETADAGMDANPYTASTFNSSDNHTNTRPACVITSLPNQPLLYDMGISSMVFPTYEIPITDMPAQLQVKLRNYGEKTVNAIRISYLIDGQTTGHYDWSGAMAGMDSATVTIANNITLGSGFHHIKVWVEDSLTAAGATYRDHEPYNDTCETDFIVCAGALSGQLQIGGTGANYNTIDEFLLALSRCGVDDSLVVKLAPGSYPPFTSPTIPGSSEAHYVVFEPLSGEVTIYVDDNTPANEAVNLEEAGYMRFRNIHFERRSGAVTNLVTLGMQSHGCHFENCTFKDLLENPSAAMRISSLLNTGFANDVVVDHCDFDGGNIGLSLVGQASDLLSSGCVARYCTFNNQYTNALNVQNQQNVLVEHNELYDVASNSSYVMLVYECHGNSRILANKMYTSHGAGAIGVSNVSGTSTQHLIVANNMVVCNDDGNANLLRTPFNIIQADYTDVLYNSVRMVAEFRSNIAAATFGGGTITNCRFFNNIVGSYSDGNYAFNYLPAGDESNQIFNNVYYSTGATLNRMSGTSYSTLANWKNVVTMDSTSISVNPGFLNGSLVDLRTFSRQVKGAGVPTDLVTVDMFDTVRSSVNPCPGAFEFTSLFYDFEPEALVQPIADNCAMPNSVELVVRLRNSGVNSFDPETNTAQLKVAYKVNNQAVQQVVVDRVVPGEDTIDFHTGRNLSLPASGINDATYTIRVWTISTIDPNQTNDTNIFTVVSRYHAPAPNDVNVSVNYATSATITPTAGIDTWQVYNNNSAPRRKSTLLWYTSMDDTVPALVGPTFTTSALRQDTQFYFRQSRSMPIVRMTQIQFLRANSTEGLTNPMPVWMATGTKVAIQLTNVGDATAYLQGDTLLTVSPTSSLNNKVYIFGDVSIEPGQSLVVQYTTGVSNYPQTIHTGTSLSPNYNANIGFIYRRGGVVEDAIALNGVISTSSTQNVSWASQGVPNYVWNGTALQITSNSMAGAYRSAFNGNVADWTIATSANPMFIDETRDQWIRYRDNGCPGTFATASVTLIAPPSADIELSDLEVAEGCGLGMEDVKVTVNNYGIQAVTDLTLNYNAGGSTVSETVVGGIAANGSLEYTFAQKLDMSTTSDSIFSIKVWATAVSGDPQHSNDTVSGVRLSMMEPSMPEIANSRTLQYATRDTLTHYPEGNVFPVWYNQAMQPVDTGYIHITDIMYTPQTIGMGYVVGLPVVGQIGYGTVLSAQKGYPSPYQPNNKYAKQQFIYSASELIAAGMQPGPITEVAFHLDSIWANLDSVSFDEYYIALGMTEDTIFGSTSDWKTTTVFYTRMPFVLRQSDVHTWVTHRLDVPFEWDGESSLVVQTAHGNAASIGTGLQTSYTSKANTTLHKNNNNALSPSLNEFVGTGTKGEKRPNIRISNVAYGCAGPVAEISYTLIGTPNVDGAISQIAGQDTIVYNSCDSVELYVNVRNLGLNNLETIPVKYTLDNQEEVTISASSSITTGNESNIQLLDKRLLPGRHRITAILDIAGDTIASNDTVTIDFFVRFCSGTYTIAQNDGDFHSFSEAIDTLNVVGIDGAVTFSVAPGTYQEQVTLTNVAGTSENSLLTFVGADDEAPLLTASTSQTDNYVFRIEGASHVVLNNLRIEARPTANNVNFANAIVLQDVDNIRIANSKIKVKGTINNLNASCIVAQGNVSRLTLFGNQIDSGYYAVRLNGEENSDIVINSNILRGFWYRGIDIRNVANLDITANQIRTGVNVNSRALTGINISNAEGAFVIQRNHVYLIDDKNGGKRGIQLNNVKGTLPSIAYVKNNMVSTSGTGIAGLNPTSGIFIDSSSAYINIYYNTVRVFASTANNPVQVNTNAFYAGPTTSHLQVMNNIFSNFSQSYAYYIPAPTSISSSNYNNYYTEGENIAFWAAPRATLTDLQAANNSDGSSMDERPYFYGVDDLHLLMTNFVDKAQYNTDVTDDIDGLIRPQIPAPTIGAHEMPRQTHDMSIVEIISPTMPVNTNNPINIESDAVLVKASFYNNGIATETNVQWYAYIEGHESTTTTPLRNLGTFQSSTLKTDSVMMPTVLGIIDTQIVHVVLVVAVDSNLADNDLTAPVYLAPAYNFEAVRMAAPSGCGLQNSTISITLKNSGFKDIPAGATFEIGYHTQGYFPSYSPAHPENNMIYISTMTDTVKEFHSLETMLPINSSRTFTFNTHTNLYPTDTAANIKVRVSGWCHYQHDFTPTNDTTGYQTSSSPVVDAFYTPDAPEGHDTTLAYGTWGEVTAEQINTRPIRWYRDSTGSPFFASNNYNTSRRWTNTPQYFSDTTYFLNCLSDKNCPSSFSPVTVHVAPRIANDMAFEEVLAPLGSRVYMSNDTVRLRIANYGTVAQSNFPITYELYRGTNLLQHVTEICHATVQPGQPYEFTFDSLLNIPTPTTTQNYILQVWTDLATDGTRRNDTIRTNYTFKSLAEGTYCTPTNGSDGVVNITRVSFNEIDFDIPPLGRAYTNLGKYDNPEVEPLHIMRGTTDSIFVMTQNMQSSTRTIPVDVGVWIDFDRSGEFTDDELVAQSPGVYMSGDLFKEQITIPSSASYGYMKMRVVTCNTTSTLSPCLESDGHVIDFLLYIEPEPPHYDIALTQIATPRSYLINGEDTAFAITFRMANKGTEHMSNVQISYRFDSEVMDSTSSGVINWAGSLMPGTSTLVSLPIHEFALGTTVVNIWHNEAGDEDTTNNRLTYEYNRFHVVTLYIDDNFDSINYWYAPTGYNNYSRNYWQLGEPAKTRISTAFSEPNAWVTDLNANVASGRRGNVSYLYSPIIDIAQIKPDTLSFRLQRNLSNGSSLHLEFCDYEGNWQKVDADSLTNWYNNADDGVFDGTSAGNAYNRYWIRTSLISGDFPEKLQFRFVYSTPQGSTDNSSYGEGCAIDDFRIGRARRAVDVGVVAITRPVAPKYGETIYPEVLVQNYGTDTINHIRIEYTTYNNRMPKYTEFDCHIAPEAVDTFRMASPFIVTSDFPDTFYITAFTNVQSDIYRDNDTNTKLFHLSPLDNDISAEEFIAPLDRVIAGDTAVPVIMRIRNFGESEISTATASYIVNGSFRVDEEIDFEALLGRPLASMEYFNYSFHTKFRATMGQMRIVGIIKDESNEYIYNDTIEKKLLGVSSITDLAATGIIFNTSGYNTYYVQLVIENQGARGANGFEVGYWIDNDTTTMVREVWGHEFPLPALTTGSHFFSTTLPDRAGGYEFISGYVHINNDNDNSNDTTDLRLPINLDIAADAIIVEENASPDCAVYFQLRNVGNYSLANRGFKIHTWVNGIGDSTVIQSPDSRIEPGQVVTFVMPHRIPKDPLRRYSGYGDLALVDSNIVNNETSNLILMNYVEDVPSVLTDDIRLEQNYPNPFSHQTTIPFSLPNSAQVTFFVMDAMGHILTSSQTFYPAGNNTISLDMNSYASGIYYYGIEVDGHRQMKKMILR